jgi:hypothetical protein
MVKHFGWQFAVIQPDLRVVDVDLAANGSDQGREKIVSTQCGNGP